MIYSAGCLDMSDLVAALQKLDIAWLWDLRVGRAGVLGQESLKSACRGRIRYRSWAIGAAAAGGLRKHLFHTEEGLTVIYRLLREGLLSRVCFLGATSSWRDDDIRAAVGVAILAAGSQVTDFKFRAQGASADIEEESQAHSFELPARLQPPATQAPKTTHEQSYQVDKDLAVNDDVDTAITSCNSAAPFRRWDRRARNEPLQVHSLQPDNDSAAADPGVQVMHSGPMLSQQGAAAASGRELVADVGALI